MKIIEVESENIELIEKICQSEKEIFGEMGGSDMWMLKSFIRCGKLYALIDTNLNLICAAEYQGMLMENDAFLYGFFTVPSEQGKGYGKFLLEQTHTKLKEIGINKVYLTVAPENIIGVKMYEKLGYKIKELNKNEYGKGVSRYLMEKIL